MLGLPTGTDLSGIADKLGAIVASLGPEESAVVTGAISQLSDHAAALEAKTAADLAADVKAAEDPLLQRIDVAIGILQTFKAFSNGFDISVTPKPKS
jgi:hypothetical protein